MRDLISGLLIIIFIWLSTISMKAESQVITEVVEEKVINSLLSTSLGDCEKYTVEDLLEAYTHKVKFKVFTSPNEDNSGAYIMTQLNSSVSGRNIMLQFMLLEDGGFFLEYAGIDGEHIPPNKVKEIIFLACNHMNNSGGI